MHRPREQCAYPGNHQPPCLPPAQQPNRQVTHHAFVHGHRSWRRGRPAQAQPILAAGSPAPRPSHHAVPPHTCSTPCPRPRHRGPGTRHGRGGGAAHHPAPQQRAAAPAAGRWRRCLPRGSAPEGIQGAPTTAVAASDRTARHRQKHALLNSTRHVQHRPAHPIPNPPLPALSSPWGAAQQPQPPPPPAAPQPPPRHATATAWPGSRQGRLRRQRQMRRPRAMWRATAAPCWPA